MLNYKHLDLELKDRVFILGDLHGQHKLFHEFLKWKDVSTSDHVIACGDLVDRGTGSVELLTHFLLAEGHDSVLGNHEEFMVRSEYLRDRSVFPLWVANGGTWCLDTDPTLLAGLARQVHDNFPVYLGFEFDGEQFMVSHAEFPFSSATDFEHTRASIEMDTITSGKDLGYLVEWESKIQQAIWGRVKVRGMTNLALGGVPGYKETFHGHTVTQNVRRDGEPLPITIANQTWIDTGACFNGRLTVIELRHGGERETHQLWFDADGELCIV